MQNYSDPYGLPDREKPSPERANIKQRLQVVSLILGIVFLIFAVGGYLAYGARTEPVDASELPGPETKAAAGCQLQNGYQICDVQGGPQILTFWTQTQGILGKPLSNYQPTSNRQVFLNGAVTYNPNERPEWRLQLELLGLQDLRNSGNIEEDRFAPVHPAVGAYLNNLQRRGVDLPRIFGDVISRPQCDKGLCKQYTERMRFEVPEKSENREDVKLSSLGKPEASRYVANPIPFYRNGPLIVCWVIALAAGVVALILYRLARQYTTPIVQQDRTTVYSQEW